MARTKKAGVKLHLPRENEKLLCQLLDHVVQKEKQVDDLYLKMSHHPKRRLNNK